MVLTSISTSDTLMNGLVIAGVGYSIVFLALVIMYFVYHFLPKIMNMNLRSRMKKEGKIKEAEEVGSVNLTGELNAAISTALYLYFNELHDDESNVVTIKKVSRTYSPWSSKIYGVRNRFNRL